MRFDLIFSLITALLISLSFPPFKFGFLAYWALVPLFYLLEEKDTKDAFRWGYIAGLFTTMATLYWIQFVSVGAVFTILLVHPLYFSLYAILHVFLRNRLGNKAFLFLPFVWTGIEYLKSLGAIGFPWIILGYTQTGFLSLIQYASYTSVFGVSFWVFVINVLVFQILNEIQNRKRVVVYLLATIMLFILPWMYGKYTIPDNKDFGDGLHVALIQGNIDPVVKWNRAKEEFNVAEYEKLSRQVGKDKADLIVWPETALPFNLSSRDSLLTRVKHLAAELDTPILTGTLGSVQDSARPKLTQNAALLISPHADYLQSYAKMHLVPFAEYLPYQKVLGFFEVLLRAMGINHDHFQPGDEVVLLNIPYAGNDGRLSLDGSLSIPVGTTICFESIFPDLVCKFVRKGARLLVVISNDALLGRKDFPWMLNAGMIQHAQMSVFRAIENRISVARCANTGISMFIDPYGRTRAVSSLFRQESLAMALPLRGELTFFSRSGNIFTKMVAVVGFFSVPLSLLAPKIS